MFLDEYRFRQHRMHAFPADDKLRDILDVLQFLLYLVGWNADFFSSAGFDVTRVCTLTTSPDRTCKTGGVSDQ